MDRGRLAHGPDARPNRPGVVMQQVELARAVVGRHGVGGLVPGIADQLLGRHLAQRRDQLRLGLGAGRGEQGDLMPALGQPVGQQRHHPLDAAITAGRNRIPGRRDHAVRIELLASVSVKR